MGAKCSATLSRVSGFGRLLAHAEPAGDRAIEVEFGEFADRQHHHASGSVTSARLPSAVSGCSSPLRSTISTRGVALRCIAVIAAAMPPRRTSHGSLTASASPSRRAASFWPSARKAISPGRSGRPAGAV